MPLAEVLEPLSWDVAFWMVNVNDPATRLDELGEICVELEGKLRAVGIILLLTKGDSDRFLHNLIRPAKHWEHFLTRCREERGDDVHDFCGGRFEPLLDALAARQTALAAQLVALAPTDFREGREHVADHAWARVLHGLLVDSPSELDVAAAIVVCAEKGDALSAARAAVGQALLVRDQGAFADAFDSLVQTRLNQIAEADARGQIAGPAEVAQREVFVEGIALLNLAEARGLATDAEYPLCPSIARTPMRAPFPGA